jgi:hypothetical protein
MASAAQRTRHLADLKTIRSSSPFANVKNPTQAATRLRVRNIPKRISGGWFRSDALSVPSAVFADL